MGSEPKPNSFRASVIRGERQPLVLTEKDHKLDGSGERLDAVAVPRIETRRGNHRGNDRHGLTSQTAVVRHEGRSHEVEVVNVSAGGAMIRVEFEPRLWDILELQFGEGASVEGAVRWLRADCVGVEFAHETRIESDPQERAALLLDVVQRSFPGQHVQLDHEEPEPFQAPEEDLGHRGEKRHPLIWRGEIHHAFDSHAVRIRNISVGGALVDIDARFAEGTMVLLDLGGAGQVGASVTWAQGQQAGLKFNEPFDISSLSKAKPEVMSTQWLVPDFLSGKMEDDSSPWHQNWSRGSLEEIRADLEGYMKR